MNKLVPYLFSTMLAVGTAHAAPDTIVSDSVLHAIHMVESGGKLKSPLGDGGRARGPYQIHYNYWFDAVSYDRSIGGKYEDVDSKEYSERIIRSYMRRYAPKGATNKDIAMIHNGGCNILKKVGSTAYSNAVRYWDKVKKHIKITKQ